VRLDFDVRSLYPLSISLRATGFDIKQDLSTALVGEVLNLASGVPETVGF